MNSADRGSARQYVGFDRPRRHIPHHLPRHILRPRAALATLPESLQQLPTPRLALEPDLVPPPPITVRLRALVGVVGVAP